MARGAHKDYHGSGGLVAAIDGSWRASAQLHDDKPKAVIRCGNTDKNCRAILRSGKKEGDFCSGCMNPHPFREDEQISAEVHAARKARSR